MIELVSNSVLAIIAIVLVVSLYRFHKDERYKHFNLIDLVTAHDGRVSRPALFETGTWLVTTWGLIVLVNKGTLPDWYITAYIGGFVLRAAHVAHLQASQQQKPQEFT